MKPCFGIKLAGSPKYKRSLIIFCNHLNLRPPLHPNISILFPGIGNSIPSGSTIVLNVGPYMVLFIASGLVLFAENGVVYI